MGNNVIHPGHYNIPGRKECIEEMVEKFGHEKTEAFCELNSYKYHYRHELKNGQEDLDKASNYTNMLQQMISNDPRFKVAIQAGLDCQMHQLVEEMGELIQAISKYFRINGQGLPVSPNLTKEKVKENLIEELADVKVVVDQLIFLLECDKEVLDVINYKINRMTERMKNNASN